MPNHSEIEQFVPTGEASAELEVRRSRFIAHAVPFDAPGTLKTALESWKSRYPDATHTAYAFVTGTKNSETIGMSDAGEPKGTAGRPILNALRGRGITNAALFVVRYFGGTKLGTGGLARAYGECAALAADRLPVRKLVATIEFRLEVAYELYEAMRRLLSDHDARRVEEQFTETVSISGDLPESALESFELAVADLSRGQVKIELGPAPRGMEG
jgi:uncharacterized YigZ family protein